MAMTNFVSLGEGSADLPQILSTIGNASHTAERTNGQNRQDIAQLEKQRRNVGSVEKTL